ncbi:MAG: hypothetical protein P4M11_15150 [Candidatus Pacebacteria bacterium]|nr:hypothetical protein [Candidatus Paceibacterota bacterium]
MAKVCMLSPLLDGTSWIVHLVIFYCVFGLLILTLVLILYAEHASQRAMVVMSWSVKLLSVWVTLLLSIFYFPFVAVMLSALDCESISGQLVHSSHHDVVCFSGTHWVHAFVGILGFTLFTAMGALFALLFYDSRMRGSRTAKSSAHNEAWEVVFRSGLVLLNLVAKWIGGNWLVWLYMLVGAGIIYLKSASERRFFVETAQKASRCFALLNLWISAIYGYVFVIQDIDDSGGIEVMLLGAILLLVTIALQRASDWKILLIDSLALQSPGQSLRKIYAYLSLALHNSTLFIHSLLTDRRRPRGEPAAAQGIRDFARPILPEPPLCAQGLRRAPSGSEEAFQNREGVRPGLAHACQRALPRGYRPLSQEQLHQTCIRSVLYRGNEQPEHGAGRTCDRGNDGAVVRGTVPRVPVSTDNKGEPAGEQD